LIDVLAEKEVSEDFFAKNQSVRNNESRKNSKLSK
jgi:hypothetical protein